MQIDDHGKCQPEREENAGHINIMIFISEGRTNLITRPTPEWIIGRSLDDFTRFVCGKFVELLFLVQRLFLIKKMRGSLDGGTIMKLYRQRFKEAH